MSGPTLVLLAVFGPLAAAVLIAAAGRWPNLREAITLATAAALFAATVGLWDMVAAGARPAVTLIALLPGVPLAFAVEPLGMIFAALAAFLWIVNSVYSIGYMRGHGETNQTRFYVLFAVAIASAVGVALAANMLTLFAFYELLTLSTYPLVAHRETEEAKRGGRTYLGILLTTSIGLQLLAILWTWHLAGTLDFAPGGILAGKAGPGLTGLLLFLYVFGIGKAAVMPVHRWLPAAMVAPTPVSALLHAVAVVKAGVFTVLKVALYIFGLDLLGSLAATDWLLYIGAASVLLASLIAMRQDDLKRRLAYSTVSQLGYVVVGAMLASGLGIIGGGLQLVMHAFGKITLFFCAGAIDIALHRRAVSQMGGIGRAMPFTMIAFFIASLSIIGLPPLGGLWGKWYLGLGSLEAGHYGVLAVLILSSLLNIAYLLPIPIRAFFGRPADDDVPSVRTEAPWPCVAAPLATALGCLVLFFFPEPVYRLLALLTGP